MRETFRLAAIAVGCAAVLITASVHGQSGLGKPPEGYLHGKLRDVLNIDAVRREFVYAVTPDRELALDIYYPRAPMPPGGYPVVLWTHGGGWLLGNKRQDVFVRWFASYGFAIASIQYHLALAEPFPAQIRDVRTAAWWLWKNARDLDLDPTQMVAAGQSAGGHLALLLAYSQGEHRRGWGPPLPEGTLRGVAALYPPTDLLRLVPPSARNNPIHPVAILLGDRVDNRMALAREASPIRHVTRNAPPTLLLHGSGDIIVPIEQSRVLRDRLRRADVRVHLLESEDGHAFTLYPGRVDDLVGFFESIPEIRDSIRYPTPRESREGTSAFK